MSRMKRMSTGISRLDDIFEGYPKGKSMLVIGRAGTGKTVLGLHFLLASLQEGQKCLLLSTEDYRDNIIIQAASFGWDLKPYLENDQLSIASTIEDGAKYKEASMELSLEQREKEIFDILEEIKGTFDVVLVDNIGIFALGTDPRRVREQFATVLHKLYSVGATPFIICDEGTSNAVNDVFIHAVFGAIRLMKRENPFTNKRERIMDIIKMRSTKVPIDFITFDILDRGINLPT